jgi:ankyrin repeat protein
MSANRQAFTDQLWKVLNDIETTDENDKKSVKGRENGSEKRARLLDIAKTFIEAGVEVNAKGNTIEDPQTLLHMAVHLHAPCLISCLLDQGANPNQVIGTAEVKADSANLDNLTAFQTAIYNRAWDCVNAFFPDGKQRPDWIPLGANILGWALRMVLHYIVHIKQESTEETTQIIFCLLNAGANINVFDDTLHLAVQANHQPVMQALLERSKDVDIRDVRGSTPLHIAAECDNRVFIKALLEKKADINAADKQLYTPIWYSAHSYNWGTIEIMLAYNPDQKSCGYVLGYATRQIPISQEARAVAFKCIERKALSEPVYLPNDYTETTFPLHQAALAGDLELACALLKNNADPNQPTRKKRTALHTAVQHAAPSQQLITRLLLAGGNPDQTNANNLAPVASIAAEDKNYEKTFIFAKAKIDAHEYRIAIKVEELYEKFFSRLGISFNLVGLFKTYLAKEELLDKKNLPTMAVALR